MPTGQRPPTPSRQPSTQPKPTTARATSAKTPAKPGFGDRLKEFAQSTRERLESLPRTEQSLGTPQQHALPTRDFNKQQVAKGAAPSKNVPADTNTAAGNSTTPTQAKPAPARPKSKTVVADTKSKPEQKPKREST
ncbi:MAG: hypothetical protein ACR2RV_04545, partial [Verrucomicrobiales bacterium]